MTSDLNARLARLSPEKRALLERRLASEGRRAAEARPPLAVVGIGCRFPGADSPTAFWKLLVERRDGITDVPRTRWDSEALFDADPAAPGKIATRSGGFLEQQQIELFDAEFFGIAPREAERLDPQQRLLLETTWEALESAGIPPGSLAGRPVGVFIGIHSMSADYYWRQAIDSRSIDAYTGTGAGHSIAANRISYLLDLRGPSIAVDTACSSSLVTIHLACQSLRAGECDVAIVGGVNLMLSPEPMVALSKTHAMAPDGRCKTFDASADGFGRGEGCGVVVLRRLDHAVESGDPVLAVIRGSAVNQDGATNGLTAPNGLSQRDVVTQALRDAGMPPERITYVETHGTGTVLGDPIEVEALADVIGRQGSGAATCVLGAVKTNIGHLESAAGIAGLIKVVLCLQHRYIPANLHFHTLNPHLALEGTRFVLPGDGLEWDSPPGEPRAASISSFGMGGTNAHVVLEEFAQPQPAPGSGSGEDTLLALPLSARGPGALRALTESYVDWLSGGDSERLDPRAIAFTASCRREHYETRRMVIGRSAREWAQELEAALSSNGRAGSHSFLRPWPGLVFVYSGQGPQWPGMGLDLYHDEPVFRTAIDRCAEEFGRHVSWSLLQELAFPEAMSRLDRTEIAQPAIFAIQYALTELCRAWGIRPDAVVGHSAGEVTAAWAAGVLRFEDAARLVVNRGRLMERQAGKGAMAALELAAGETLSLIERFGNRLDLGAMNSPTSSVVSGDPDAIDEIVGTCKELGIFAKRLPVRYAFHSRQMEALQPELVEMLADLRPAEPVLSIASAVTGALAAAGDHDARYWARNMREPVRFADAVGALAAAGQRVFLELSPHPILGSMIARWREQELIACGTLHKNDGGRRAMLQTIGVLYEHGLSVDFSRIQPSHGPVVPLPPYQWQRSRFWFTPIAGPATRGSGRSVHPLLGERLSSAIPIFESSLAVSDLPSLGDHRVFEVAVMPAAAYIEMACAAASRAADRAAHGVTDLIIQQPLVIPDEARRTIQVVATTNGSDGATIQFFSRSTDSDEPWTMHGAATVSFVAAPRAASASWDPELVQARCSPVVLPDLYERLAERGLHVGPAWHGLEELWQGDGEALGRVRGATIAPALRFDPVWLDACLQTLAAATPADRTSVLSSVERLSVWGTAGRAAWSHASIRTIPGDAGTLLGDLRVFADDGVLLLEATGIRLKQLAEVRPSVSTSVQGDTAVYEVAWRPQALDVPADAIPVHSVSRSPQQLTSGLSETIESLRAKHRLDVYERLVPELEALSIECVLGALRDLGWRPAPGERVSTAGLIAKLGIVPLQRRLFERLCEMLTEEGYLRAVDGQLVVVGGWEMTDVRDRCAQLRRAYPACRAELDLMERCGTALAAVLSGETDAVQVLFPGGSFEMLEGLYRDSSYSCIDGSILQQVLSRVVADWPEDRPLRVLEIGAGTGGSTTYALGALPRERTEYTFTDVSQLFLVRARQKFRNAAFLRYEILDIEKNPADQGFAGREFDIVIAANVLHATADLRRTLRHVRQLLAPGGLLALLEVTRPQRWIDLTFGLTDGWWRFSDFDLRPRRAVLSPADWIALLGEQGFQQPVALPDPRDAAQESVLVARAAASEQQPARTRWLIVPDANGVAETLADRVRAAGEEPVVIANADLDAALARMRDDDVPCRAAVYLRSLDAETSEAFDNSRLLMQQVERSDEVVRLGRGLAAVPGARLWIVTRDAQAVRSAPLNSADAIDPAQAAAWGLGRVMALEQAETWGGLIDVDSEPTSIASRVYSEITAGASGEDQVAWRGDQRYVPRLTRIELPASGSPRWTSDGAYLITGGLGGVGLLLARGLADRGVRHLVLTGRTGIGGPGQSPAEAMRRSEAVDDLKGLGVDVTVASVDVADERGMTDLFARFGASLPPLRGVFHAAAAVDMVSLREMSRSSLHATYRTKIAGGWLLHRLTRDRAIDQFVLFSSTTALLGAATLGHYAAANCFLDALAHYRRASGLPALSVNWGTWEAMRSFSSDERALVERHGLRPMPAERALGLLDQALADGRAQLAIAAVDWTTLKAAYEARRARPFLQELAASRVRTGARRQPETDLRTHLLSAAPARRHELLLDAVRRAVVGVLGYPEERPIDSKQGLFDLGMDSLMSVDLRTRLEALVGCPLPAGLTFSYPNIEALTVYLGREVLHLDDGDAVVAPVPPQATTRNEPPVTTVEAPLGLEETLALFDAELAAINNLVRD